MDAKIKGYISGPMTGYDNYNREKFAEAEAACREIGWKVYNPGWGTPEQVFSYEELLQIDLLAMNFCNAMIMLPDFERSNGAMIEVEQAIHNNMDFYYYTGDYRILKGNPPNLEEIKEGGRFDYGNCVTVWQKSEKGIPHTAERSS